MPTQTSAVPDGRANPQIRWPPSLWLPGVSMGSPNESDRGGLTAAAVEQRLGSRVGASGGSADRQFGGQQVEGLVGDDRLASEPAGELADHQPGRHAGGVDGGLGRATAGV